MKNVIFNKTLQFEYEWETNRRLEMEKKEPYDKELVALFINLISSVDQKVFDNSLRIAKCDQRISNLTLKIKNENYKK